MTGSVLAGMAVIFLAAMLTNNILLAKFMGMCSFIAISRNMRTALGMGVAVTFVTFCTAILNYGIYYGILVKDAPLCAADLTYLTFLVFIMLIAGFVQFVEMVIERFSPVLHYNLGIFLPLITVNCAILGVNLLMIDPERNFGLAQTAAYALGSGLGWLLAICLMAGIRQRLELADVPKPLVGLGITVIVTGLMAMAFMGFSGMVDL
ncbi:MAG: NADH:ubiquinone reductase (Na(+)-transporting) subunit E [Kiritimatiellae bacterium]|nr:NADH:ubiquinone reductase (Na(+)-transporting) subunit E [Kiritimatiellia bacterium]